AAGNDTLTVVARIIRPSVREQDVVARLGGDEFVAVLSGEHDAAIADDIVSRISSAVDFLLPLGADSAIRIGASIGRAIVDETTPFADALNAADADAYRIKADDHARLRRARRPRQVAHADVLGTRERSSSNE
ncbi:MAG: diguanylate cyclase, partial [Candidatus Eremiobacteraeota bacterium]|nr:diguanylate cyclase [Candidatus Eremiobacteraeota bacterium]